MTRRWTGLRMLIKIVPQGRSSEADPRARFTVFGSDRRSMLAAIFIILLEKDAR